MDSYFISTSGKIHYRITGKGDCVILLHGYLENLEIWKNFADELSKSYQVLLIDFPGHGKSEGEANTVENMAESVNAALANLKIAKAAIVGHSMGGYVALAFADLFTAKTAGLCLFHSTPYADSDQKMLNRMNEIEQVRRGEKQTIVDMGIPLRFADKNLPKFEHELTWAKEQALSTSDSVVNASLQAMSSRPDRNYVIEKATYPTMMIFGAQDNHIPLSIALDLEQRHKKTRTVFLNNSGHMGFIEEKDQALKAINSFLEYVFS